MESTYKLTVWKAAVWVVAYFGVMLLYTLIDMLIWRMFGGPWEQWLNLITMTVCSVMFFRILTAKTSFHPNVFGYRSASGIAVAILCSITLFLLLDHCLDPLFESLFPASEEVYQDSLSSLAASPVIAFLHVVILAPVVEETLIRGFVLDGIKSTRGTAAALLVSTLLFAFLHFNMVQTLSAVMAGFILGLLYLKTNSLLCCMIAHAGYNMISFFATIVPFIK